MRPFSDYLNTPEIADEPLYLREVHAARLKIHDERRGISDREFVDSLNAKYADVLNEYGPSTKGVCLSSHTERRVKWE